MNKIKKDDNHIHMTLSESFEKGGYLQAEDCKYTPKPNDRVILYEKDNQYILHMKFNTGYYIMFIAMKFGDIEKKGYRKVKTMSYKKAVCFLRRKGYIRTDSNCMQICSCYQNYYVSLVGRLDEYWEHGLTSK